MKETLQKLKSGILRIDKLNLLYIKVKQHFGYYLFCTLTGLYLYGIIINIFRKSTESFYSGVKVDTFTLNPFICIAAVFTPQGLGVLVFIAIMYVLITGKWTYLITGIKITKDDRNFFVSSEGTHGTSGWMTKQERKRILVSDTADSLPSPILCKLKENNSSNGYVGLRGDSGLNKHILIYGATGAGKSRGFVKPFILKMVQMMKSGQKPQSMIIVDPKAELFEQYSEFLRNNGYVVKALNLLDMENSDGWNCIGETEGDVDMVQSVAEIIIRNTSEDGQKADFWDKAEGNRAPVAA